MPLYEYECDNCGNRFERIQSVRDEPIKQCPNCSSNTVHKVFHPAGIIFKGSGWYITDSRKSSSATAPTSTKSASESKTSSESTPATETKAETKTDSKPATGESK